MIRVHRSAIAPKVLTGKGVDQTRIDGADFESAPAAYANKTRTFPKKSYYSSTEVKRKLKKMQYCKCCYCERKVYEGGELDVDHFRPKGGFRQRRRDTDTVPGYFWLTYDWTNLLLSCQTCNRSFKKTLFPLVDPKQRADPHLRDASREQPLLINPVDDDPRNHIEFTEDVPHGLTHRGSATIIALGLCRGGLTSERPDYLITIRHLYAAIEKARANPANLELQEVADEMRQAIRDAERPDAKFSAMVADFVRSNPV